MCDAAIYLCITVGRARLQAPLLLPPQPPKSRRRRLLQTVARSWTFLVTQLVGFTKKTKKNPIICIDNTPLAAPTPGPQGDVLDLLGLSLGPSAPATNAPKPTQSSMFGGLDSLRGGMSSTPAAPSSNSGAGVS